MGRSYLAVVHKDLWVEKDGKWGCRKERHGLSVATS